MLSQSAHKTTAKQKLTLIIVGLFLSLLLLEAGLRIAGWILSFRQEYRNKISIQQKGTYRILCLGESTTAFGGKFSYPRQLETILNNYDIGTSFSVVNLGVPGIDSNNILDILTKNLNKYKPRMVIVMMGINDQDDFGSKFYSIVFEYSKILKLIKNYVFYFQTDNALPVVAEKILMNAIRNNPNEYDNYIYLGEYYNDIKDLNNARKMFNMALKLDSKNESAYDGLIKSYLLENNFNKSEDIIKKALDVIPDNPTIKELLNHHNYISRFGSYDMANSISISKMLHKSETNSLNPGINNKYFNALTVRNYHNILNILNNNDIIPIFMNYPMRSLESLREIFKSKSTITFIDNETIFKNAILNNGALEYFSDAFAGDFGHCTTIGNKLLADNVADVILRKHFNN